MNLPAPQSDWAKRICACWRQSVESILETGQLLKEAKLGLGEADWKAMVEVELPFGLRTAQRLIAIGADPRLTTHASLLPPSWMAVYEVHKLDDEELEAKIIDGTINPEMERKDISSVAKAAARVRREADLGAKQQALPNKRYGVILADPEWRFEPWSRKTGMDRAADNHYPTSAMEAIAARDVPSIAADDCVLFLWSTAPMLPHALCVMGAWGFDYKSHVVWLKLMPRPEGEMVAGLAIGTGYWFRNTHELLLVGTKGKIPAPAPGTQRMSVASLEIGAHSVKPDGFLEMIEQYFPSLPKIELNRRGPPRPGWDAWGFEAVTEAA